LSVRRCEQTAVSFHHVLQHQRELRQHAGLDAFSHFYLLAKYRRYKYRPREQQKMYLIDTLFARVQSLIDINELPDIRDRIHQSTLQAIDDFLRPGQFLQSVILLLQLLHLSNNSLRSFAIR